MISATARAPSHRCGRQPSAATARVVEYLLDAGADPNTPAFAGATPLHVAMQRGHHDLVPRLLAAGADPDRVDDHGRTPADWLALHRPDPGGRAERSGFVPTGIRAVDLFAPLHRGRVQHWPPAVGLGQTVLLFAIAAALRPAEFWLVGFEHGPYSQAGAEHEIRETGVDCRVHLAAAGADAGARPRASSVECARRLLSATRSRSSSRCSKAPGTRTT